MSDADLSHQPLTEHLRDLRTCIVRSLWGILAASILCYNFSNELFDFIRAPIHKYLPAGGLVFTAPTDKFVAVLKVAFFGGVLMASPWWLYQVWRFVAPGLYLKEKKYALAFISIGTLLFLAGAAFAYYLAAPTAFEFLMTFGGDVDKPMITIDHYLSFFMTFLFVFGFAFELPLLIVILGMMGVVSQQFLREKRRYIIVGMSILAAIVTPPDVVSMILLLGPLCLLFEISILLVGFFEKKAAADLAETDAMEESF